MLLSFFELFPVPGVLELLPVPGLLPRLIAEPGEISKFFPFGLSRCDRWTTAAIGSWVEVSPVSSAEANDFGVGSTSSGCGLDFSRSGRGFSGMPAARSTRSRNL